MVMFVPANYRFRWFPGVLAFSGLIFAGAATMHSIDNSCDRCDRGIGEADPGSVKLFLLEETPVKKSRSYSANVRLIGIIDSLGDCTETDVRVIAYLPDDSSTLELASGDAILADCDLGRVSGPANPAAFDFSTYLYYRYIRWQANIPPGRWSKAPDFRSFGMNQWAERSRDNFARSLKNAGIDGDELALASALILGDRELLSREVVQEFSSAGAVHVLSVSGLHVGIMYLMAQRILFFLKRGRHGRKVQQVTIIALIWAYAFLTGLPSSVIRASLMFTLLACSNMMNRSHDGFNILAGALMIQLWINPYEITQVGFQLSYLAVAGIFAFYKPLNQLFPEQNRVTSWIWSVMAVSIAAQIATFPLAGHYFHFFPAYFLVTNLVVVPLAGIIVYLALAVLIGSFILPGASWFAWPLKYGLALMLDSVGFIQSWPGAVISPILLDPLQVVLLFASITGLFVYFVLKARIGLWLILLPLALVLAGSGWRSFRQSAQAGLTVYALPGQTGIEFFEGSNAVFIGDSSLLADRQKISFQVGPNRLQSGINNITELPLDSCDGMYTGRLWIQRPFCLFMDKKLALIRHPWHPPVNPDTFQLDILIVSGNRPPHPEAVFNCLRAGQVVLDSSVPEYMSMKWELACTENKTPCHRVRQQGAYVVQWK